MHYTAEELRVHLLTPDPAIDGHVRECADCRDELAFTAEFEAALREPELWEAIDELRQPFAPRADDLAAAREMEEQDQQAIALLAPALVSIGAFQQHEVEVSLRFRSPGVVRVLVREAKRVRDSSPKFASLLASAAIRIAAKPGGRQVHRVVLGAAWLERGIAAAMIGSYRESEDALRHAEELFEEAGNTWDLATVWLSRANVFNETERFDDALALSTAAAEVFKNEYADVSRHLRASLVRGTILYYRRMYRESIGVFESMLEEAAAVNDSVTHARALHNAANSYLGARELDTAAAYYLRALALWDQLGSDSELARTRWRLASIEIARGKWQQGYDGLSDVRREFVALGLANDEAIVRLEMAEVLLLMGRTSEVRPLLDGIAVHFATEGMTRKARWALACLAEADQPPSREDIQKVREYLTQLPTSPSAPLLRLR